MILIVSVGMSAARKQARTSTEAASVEVVDAPAAPASAPAAAKKRERKPTSKVIAALDTKKQRAKAAPKPASSTQTLPLSVPAPAPATSPAPAPASAPASASAAPPPEELECGVCFETVTLRGVLDSCDHAFCFDCITEWAKIENTCPHCKARFKSLKKLLVSAEAEVPVGGKGPPKKRGRAATAVRIPKRTQGVVSTAQRREMASSGALGGDMPFRDYLSFLGASLGMPSLGMTLFSHLGMSMQHIRSGPLSGAYVPLRAGSGAGAGAGAPQRVAAAAAASPAARARPPASALRGTGNQDCPVEISDSDSEVIVLSSGADDDDDDFGSDDDSDDDSGGCGNCDYCLGAGRHRYNGGMTTDDDDDSDDDDDDLNSFFGF